MIYFATKKMIKLKSSISKYLMFRWLCVGFYFLFLAVTANASEAPVLDLYSEKSHWALKGYLDVAQDNTDVSIPQLFEDDSLFSHSLNVPVWGFKNQPQWVRFTIRSHLSEACLCMLDIAPAFTDDIQLYWIDAKSKLQTIRTGDLIPTDQRPINLPQLILPITLEPGEERVFLLRISSADPLSADIHLWKKEAFLLQTQKNNFYMSAYLILLATITFSGLIYSLPLKSKLYKYYTLYVFSQFSFQLASSGYLGWLTAPSWPYFSDFVANASIFSSMIFFGLLFVQLTQMNQDHPRLTRDYIYITGIVSGLCLLLSLTEYKIFGNYFSHIYIVILIIFSVVFSLYRIQQKKYKLGGYCFFIYGILAVGLILHVIRSQGLISHNFWSDNAIYIGTLIHLFSVQFMVHLQIFFSLKESEKTLEYRIKKRTEELLLSNKKLKETNDRNLLLQAELQKSLRQESRIRETQQDFLRMVSNEFRSPLSVIDGAITLLSMSDRTEYTTRLQWLERIRGAKQRLTALVDTSLWDQRLADEKWQPSSVNIDLNTWLLQLAENLRRMYNDRDLQFQAMETVSLDIDADILKMVLQNLIDTVVLQTPPSKKISLESQVSIDRIYIIIGITGAQLNPELSDELKRPYGKSKTGGLYMAGLAVKRLGGTLDYMCIEQGASFIVTLPTGKKKVSLND